MPVQEAPSRRSAGIPHCHISGKRSSAAPMPANCGSPAQPNGPSHQQLVHFFLQHVDSGMHLEEARRRIGIRHGRRLLPLCMESRTSRGVEAMLRRLSPAPVGAWTLLHPARLPVSGRHTLAVLHLKQCLMLSPIAPQAAPRAQLLVRGRALCTGGRVWGMCHSAGNARTVHQAGVGLLGACTALLPPTTPHC